MSNSPDNRRHKRFRISQIVEITLKRETFFGAHGENLSEGGLLLRTDYPVEPFAEIFVMIDLPGEESLETIKAEGVVVHAEEKNGRYACGVEFHTVTAEDREKLVAYLKETDARP